MEERDSTCQVYDGQLLMCNANSALGKKFQSYLNVIGYIPGGDDDGFVDVVVVVLLLL